MPCPSDTQVVSTHNVATDGSTSNANSGANKGESGKPSSPLLLLYLYLSPPSGAESFHRWPTPFKRIYLNADEDIVKLMLELLREGGPGSHVHVEIAEKASTLSLGS